MSIDDWVWVHTGRANGHWMHRSLVPTARPAPLLDPRQGTVGELPHPGEGAVPARPLGHTATDPEPAEAASPPLPRQAPDTEWTESELRAAHGDK